MLNERVQIFDMNDESRFLVHNRKEVVQVLSDLSRWRTEISAICEHSGKIVITRVINVDHAQGVVYLDPGHNEVTSRSLLESDHVTFTTSGGLKVMWSTQKLHSVRLSDGPAFRIGLPNDLIRVQRREYYRLMTPMVNPIVCKIPLGDEVGDFPIIDISAGGISVMAPDVEELDVIEGAEFENCRFDLPEIGATNLSLRVKWIAPTTIKSGAVRYRLGMEFIEPSRGNQAMIQRYMVRLERESVAVGR